MVIIIDIIIIIIFIIIIITTTNFTHLSRVSRNTSSTLTIWLSSLWRNSFLLIYINLLVLFFQDSSTLFFFLATGYVKSRIN